MITATERTTSDDATATALLVASGLTDDQIDALIGRDAREVRAIVEAPARELSVIERAHKTLLARRQH